MRLVLRLLAFVALSVAVILGIGDATRTVATGELGFAPLSAVLEDFSPATLAAVEHLRDTAAAWRLDGLVGAVTAAPAVAVFAVLFLLLYWPSLKRRSLSFG